MIKDFIKKILFKDELTKYTVNKLENVVLLDNNFTEYAENQTFDMARNFFNTFGFCALRNYLSKNDVNLIDQILIDFYNHYEKNTHVFLNPVELSANIRQIVFTEELSKTINAIAGSFWYYGSDASYDIGNFGLHRDTFFYPSLFKIFIPVVPCSFRLSAGSHHYSDSYAKQLGRYICDWDKSSRVPHALSSIIYDFDKKNDNRVIVGGDDSQINPPITRIPLLPGDILIFQQNCVHGLDADDSKNAFLAISCFPSPENADSFHLTRTEHLDKIMQSCISSIFCEKSLANLKRVNPSECNYPYQSFSPDILNELLISSPWKKHLGFSRFSKNDWDEVAAKYSYSDWEIMKNPL